MEALAIKNTTETLQITLDKRFLMRHFYVKPSNISVQNTLPSALILMKVLKI